MIFLCVFDVLSKYVWVFSLKGQKGIKIANAFQSFSHDFILVNCKPDKILVDKDNEFGNKSIKSWLQNNDIEVYSTHNKGKCNVAKTFIRTLKTKFINILLQYQNMCMLTN